ncbi:MAG TPA: TerB family tellurite resistance protein [Gammaproteobacteria bacterium]|nr:TerB family tellurite resistance protein [Gammaproteobacteria bacterium]
MLSVIKRLRQSLAAAAETAVAPFSDLQLAAGVLLLEVGSSDFEHHPEEKAAALGALGRAFGLNAQQLEILYEHAVHSADNAVSLYEFIGVINRECDQAQKMRLLEDLWRVAFADGRLDKYEDHRIRRIAELLYMPHRAFIQSKHAAEAAISGKGVDT